MGGNVGIIDDQDLGMGTLQGSESLQELTDEFNVHVLVGGEVNGGNVPVLEVVKHLTNFREHLGGEGVNDEKWGERRSWKL